MSLLTRTVLTRAIAPAAALAALLAAGLATGCSSASSAPAAGTAATARPAAATIQAWPGGTDVYLAESQDPRGTSVHEPRCATGCPLSGDGTIVLWDMTWSQWDGAEAVGAGTEKIESCNPDCASGGQYSVKVGVTFTQPVKDCGDGGIYFWTHAAFTWPAGLPAALRGGNGPINPWDFTQLRTVATDSCG
jgi:hypothetical protein